MADQIDELRDAISAQRKFVEERMEQLRTEGAPRAETQAALDRASNAVTKLAERLDAAEQKVAEDKAIIAALEERANRQQLLGGGRAALSDERVEKYAAFQGAMQKKRIDPAHIDIAYIDAYKSAFEDYMRHGQDKASRETMTILNAAIEGTGQAGGYFVEPDMGGRLVEFIYESSPVRQVANVQETSSDALTGQVQLGTPSSGWVGETASRTATTTTSVFQWEIPKREIYANPPASQRLIDDARIDIAAWLERNVRRAFAQAEATAFVTGTAALQPRGFTTYTAGTPSDTSQATWQLIEQVVTGNATAVTADGLISLVGALKEVYRSNARFMFARSTETVLRQLKDGMGNYLLVPDMANPARTSLLGYPVSIAADLAAINSAALPIAFGDFNAGYQIVDDPAGVRVLVDPYTNKPYTQFYTTRRVGGDVVNFEAIKLQVVST